MNYFLYLTLLSLLYTQQYSIHGVVKDSVTGETLAGAMVYVENQATYTNAFGYFSFQNIKEKKVLVNCSLIGYKSKKVTTFSDFGKLTLLLSPATGTEEEILVEASSVKRSIERPFLGISHIPMRMLNNFPTIGGEQDVLKAVQLTPGVSSGQEFTNALYVRGGNSGQNLILLDDVPIYNANHLLGIYSIFNPLSLKTTELFKGSMPAKYGGKLSSVLNIGLKEGNRNAFKVEGGVSLLSAQLMVEGPISDNASFHIAYRRAYSDMLIDLFETDTELYFYDLTAKLNLELSETDHLYLSGYFGKDYLRFQGDAHGPTEPGSLKLKWNNQASHLRWTHIASSNAFIRTSLIYSGYESEYSFNFSSPPTERKPSIKSVTVKSELDYKHSKRHAFQFGLSASQYDIRAQSYFHEEDTEQRFKPKEYSAYVEHEWGLTKSIRLNNGFRTTAFNDLFNIEPRLNLNFILDQENVLKLSYNRNYQYLHVLSSSEYQEPAQIYYPASALLSPQKADIFSLGYEKTRGNYSFKSEAYYKTLTDMSMLTTGHVDMAAHQFPNYIAKGNGHSYGLELGLEKHTGKFTWAMNYAYNYTEYQFDKINQGELFRPKFHKPHQLNLTGNYDLFSGLKLGGFFKLTSGQLVTTPSNTYHIDMFPDRGYVYTYDRINNFRTPLTYRFDLNIRYLFEAYGGNWDLNISLYNILGSPDPMAVEYDYSTGKLTQYNAGFIPTFGLKFQF